MFALVTLRSCGADGIKSVSREPQGDGAATGERHVVEGKVAAVLTVAVRFTINCMLGVSILADPSNERLVQRLLSLPDLQGLLQGFAKPHPYQVRNRVNLSEAWIFSCFLVLYVAIHR